jgi:hypothetical protein
MDTDPENIPLGENVELEVLLTSRIKALETDLTDCKRDLRESRKLEATSKVKNMCTCMYLCICIYTKFI